MPWLEIWVEEAENIAKRLVDILPKKEEEEPIIKKQCLEKESLPTQKEEIKRPRFNSI